MTMFRFPAVLCALMFVWPLRAASKPNWPPLAPAELAETAPKLEPEAPAEALLVTIEVDDTDFPQERRITEYIRYKIFAPDKVEHITRISGIDSTGSTDRVELRARLTLSDGRTQEFGKESIKERTLAKKGNEGGFLGWLAGSGTEVKEKFLAVSGVEAGAILEYQITRHLASVTVVSAFTLQREGIPVRQGKYLCRLNRDTSLFGNRTFVLNMQGAKLNEDRKAHTLSLDAANLPSIVHEPFVGPVTDYALTIVSCYELYERGLISRSGKVPMPGTIEPKFGPWAPYSTLINWHERDSGWATPRVKQLAAELTQGLTDPAAKALAIHTKVQNLYQQHRRRAGPRPEERKQPNSLDDVMDVEKKPEIIRFTDEFVWLAIALYQSAGLEAHTVLLPDRKIARFNMQHVSPVFLPHKAVAVKIGDEWRFSAPQTINRMPFGVLPWEQEGQVGMLALDRKQDFIKVPPTPNEQSEITSKGKFQLEADGTLTGECTRTFTGQTAVDLRGLLRKNQKTRREEIALTKFGFDPKVAEMKITKIEALDDAEKPLSIACRIRWPGFATRTKDRLLVRAAVFRVEAASPFTATERRHPIHFPYRWRENDRVQITLPEGFEPEAPSAPAPSPGKALHQETQISYDRAGRTLHLSRTFISNVLDVGPDFYPALKAWYDRVARTDQHEVVFSRRAEKTAASSEN